MFGMNPFFRRVKTKMSKVYDNELTKSLEKGDVIVHRAMPAILLSNVISEFTSSPYCHAEVYIRYGWSISAEAYGMTFSDKMNKTMVDVFQYKGELTDYQRSVISEKAHQSMASPYEYGLLISIPWITRKRAIKRAANSAYICSENVAWCYKEAGIDLVPGTPESIEGPIDLAYSKELEYKGTYNNGKFLGDDKKEFLYKRHELQGKIKWYVRLLIWLLKKLSKKDEFYKELHREQRALIEELMKTKS